MRKVKKKLIEVSTYPLILLGFLILIMLGLRNYLLPQMDAQNLHRAATSDRVSLERHHRASLSVRQAIRDRNGVPDGNRAYRAADRAAPQSRPPSTFGASLEWAARHR